MIFRTAFSIGLFTLLLASPAASQHTVVVADDGSYSPSNLVINAGDEVTWTFPSGDIYRAIVRLSDAPSSPATDDNCTAFSAWNEDAENPFTGPMPQAVSGITVLSPNDGANSVQTTATADADCLAMSNFRDGADLLCPDDSLPIHHTLQEVIDHPGVSSIFLRFNWNEIEPAAGNYHFADLDTEIERIIAAGKLYTLSFRAGQHGTPEWLGDELHLPMLQLQDGSTKLETGCGRQMMLGNPTDPQYGQRYNQMLKAVAAHLQENAAYWRALAYVKPSGANLFSHENRLPNRCTPGCTICNPEVFAAAGYTPEGLYDFYENQIDAIAAYFPGKSMAYMLIQAGFPKVLDGDNYEGCLAAGCDTSPVGGTEQTTEILERGVAAQGDNFIVEHNGLGPIDEIDFQIGLPGSGLPTPLPTPPLPSTGLHTPGGLQGLSLPLCPIHDQHPPDPDPTIGPELGEYRDLPNSCPNPWVLYHGANYQYTGWQTVNTTQVSTLPELDATLRNALRNGDGMFVEVYQQLVWLAARNPGVLDPGVRIPRDLETWADIFHQRRRDAPALGWPNLPDPFPSQHVHTFQNAGSDPVTYWYTDPKHCDPALANTFGSITVNP